MSNKYGTCERCGTDLIPIWFTEEERKVVNGIMSKTGRTRQAVDVLSCPHCLKEYCVDDSFDGNWR